MRHYVLLCVVGTGCAASSTDLQGLESALGAAAALGSAVSTAMNALSGTPGTTACASVTTACAGYPCQGAVAIQLGAGCPLPLGGTASGTVNVSGSWQSADSATLGTEFVNARTGTHTVVVVKATNLTVSRSPGSVSVTYVGQDVNVASGAATLSAQASWTVHVTDPSTPGDPTDDTLSIDGSDQSTGGAVTQISASGVTVSPACRKNPTGGSATLQKVSTFTIVQSTVKFHTGCDGKADVTNSGSTDSVAMSFVN